MEQNDLGVVVWHGNAWCRSVFCMVHFGAGQTSLVVKGKFVLA